MLPHYLIEKGYNMTKRQLIEQIRVALKDTKQLEYPDSELLMYIDDSVEYLSTVFAHMHSSYTKARVWVASSPLPIPHDFIVASKNTDDVEIFDNTIVFNNVPTEFVYYKRLKLDDNIDSEINIPSELITPIKQDVINKALLRNEYSIQLEEQNKQIFVANILEISKKREGIVSNIEKKLKYEV